MPRYTIQDPVSKKTIELVGDSPPTEQELKKIFAELILNDPNRKPAATDDFLPAPTEGPGVLEWLTRMVKAGMPSADLVQALATHDPAATLRTGHAIIGGVVDQGKKLITSGKAALHAPNGVQRAMALSEAAGHLGGMIPGPGTFAAQTGENWADPARRPEAVGGTLALLGPSALKYGTEVAQTGKLAPTVADTAAVARARQLQRSTVQRPLMKEDARQTVAQEVLNPANPKYKAVAQRIAPQILDRGLKGSREELALQARDNITKAGVAMDNALAQYPNTRQVRTAPILQAMDDTLQDLTAKGISGATEVNPVSAGQYATLKGLRDFLARRGSMMTYDQLNAIRQKWDTTAAQAGGYAHKTGNAHLGDTAWATREGATAIRNELASDRPDVATIKSEMSFWLDLQDVLSPTKGRPKPASASPGARLAGQITGAAAGGVGGAVLEHATGATMGAPAIGAILGERIGAGVARAMDQAFSSPKWKLASAAKKHAIADALASRNYTRAMDLLKSVVTEVPRAGATGPVSAPAPAVTFPKAADRDERRQ